MYMCTCTYICICIYFEDEAHEMSWPPCGVLQCVAMHCSVLQCVTLCCSVWQCVAVYCSVLHCVAVRATRSGRYPNAS